MVIVDALRRCAINYSKKLAIKDEYGKHFPQGFSYTYQELFETVNRLANGLIGLGLRKGDRVAVQTGTGIGPFVSLLALIKAGMAMTPIDRTYMAEEITYQVQDSGARGFIVDADIYQTKIDGIRSRLTSGEYFIGIGKENPCPYDFDALIREGSPKEPQIKVQ